MKKLLPSLLFLFITLLFAGCDKEAPIVDFIYEDRGKGEFYFENTTYWLDYQDHKYNIYWYIDDSKLHKTTFPYNDQFESFSYTFPLSGTYKVKLEIYDYNKQKYYKEVKNIKVSLSSDGGSSSDGYPVASFDYEFYDNFEVDFYNESRGATSYTWSFGDGKSSTEKDPEHIYSKPGTYTVTLTAKNSKGTHKATSTITITKPAYTYFLGITYEKVPQLYNNYKFVLTDDDIFTTTWGKSEWVYISSTPYDCEFVYPKLLDGLADDDYYELSIYKNKENSSGKIANWKIYTTSLTQDYSTDLSRTSSDGLTRVTVYFSYEKEPLSYSAVSKKIEKAKKSTRRETTQIIEE